MAAVTSAGDRRGEKLGWTLGYLGGFVWVVILAGIFAAQGRWVPAAAGLVLVAVAVAAVVAGAPWRHPSTPYWKLMLPVYLCFGASLAWFVRYWDGPLGLNPWQLFVLAPALLPFWIAGRRCWDSPS